MDTNVSCMQLHNVDKVQSQVYNCSSTCSMVLIKVMHTATCSLQTHKKESAFQRPAHHHNLTLAMVTQKTVILVGMVLRITRLFTLPTLLRCTALLAIENVLQLVEALCT